MLSGLRSQRVGDGTAVSEEEASAAGSKPAPSRARAPRPRTTRAGAPGGAGEEETPAAGSKPASPRAKASRPRASRASAAGKGEQKETPVAGSTPAAGSKQASSRARASRPRTTRAKAGAGGEEEAAAAGSKPARRRAGSPHPPTRVSNARGETAAPPGVVGPGDEIAGYRIAEQIGEGGMAVVYRADDERLGRRVALKLLAPAMASDTGFRHRFIRESRAAAAVDHPNIIPIYEAGDAGGALFIAMRYVQGGDVGSLLEHDGPLSAARAWSIISQVAEALDAAHAHGLIHRDVKPANMLLDARTAAAGPAESSAAGQHEHVYLSDFGISKQPLSAKTLTVTGQFVGTLDYIAPEQIEGSNVDGRADLYSLGCAAFEMLSGEPPFRRGRGLALINAHLSEPVPLLTARCPDLPPAVDRVLAGAMAKSADDRYATCAEFATDLGRALGLVPGDPEPPDVVHLPATVAAAPVPAPAASPAPGIVPGGEHVPPDAAWPMGPGEYSPYGSYPPTGQPPTPRRRSRGLRAGLISLAVVLALAAGAAAAVAVVNHGRFSATPQPSPTLPTVSPTPSPKPRPSPSPSAQALAVSNLLVTGTTSSTTLTDAADNVQSCTNLNQSVRQIRKVRDQRQTEYDQAQQLTTGALSNGAALKADLVQSLLDSLNADNDYLSWAQQQAANCQFGSQSSAALAADQQAVKDKTNFVRLWNGIAATYSLPSASVSSI
jgi:serine/threonine protein kinase